MKGDIADQAQETIEAFENICIGAARLVASRVETDPNFDGQHCVTCDDIIPDARLALKKIRCVGCQGLLEKGKL